MALCSRCGIPHSRLRGNSRPQSYCLACHAKHMRETRPSYSQLSEEQKFKVKSRSYANVYQRRGKLVPQSCSICGGVAQKHHDCYAKPLEVKWFCRNHHMEIHQEASL